MEEKVIELHLQGKTPQEISKELSVDLYLIVTIIYNYDGSR